MIDEIKKSISATLYERTTSPLFGTFFFSWSVWNWKIIIALFFTTAEELKMTKFEYIDINLLNVYDGLIYPIISTIIILTLYAWVSEQAYRLWLYFDKRKNDHKNTIEKQKLLTKEQSMKIRLELSKQENSFENLIKDKEGLITALKNEISELQSKFNNSDEINIDNIISGNENILKEDKDLEKFFNNENAVTYFEVVANYVQHGWGFDSEKIPDNITSYFIAHNLIQNTSRNGVFEFTEKGKEYLREYFDRKN
jgi:hypothetical protein